MCHEILTMVINQMDS